MTIWTFISKYIWQLLFGVAIIVIFFMDTCKKPCPPVDNTIKIDTAWIHDTIHYTDSVYVPKVNVVYKTDSIIKWKDIAVDTQAILDMYVDYFAYVISIDTILNDTNGFVRISDTIQKNRIKNRNVEKKFYPTYIRITKGIKEAYVPKNEFYAGGAVGGSLSSFGAEVAGMFINKKKHAYIASYDLVQKEIKVGVMIKIF